MMSSSRLADDISARVAASGVVKSDGGSVDAATQALAKAIAEAVIAEITTYAEVPNVPPAVILPGTVSVGAGPAAAPSPAPIPTQQPPIPPGSIK